MNTLARFAALLALVAGCSHGNNNGGTGSGSSSDMSPAATADGRPAGVTLCYTSQADQLAATKGFWTALGAADYGTRPASVSALDAAVQQYPDEEELALLDGLDNLWRIAEPTAAESNDMAGLISAALASKAQLQHAFDLCPTDYRIPAWLGPMLVNMGRQLNDQATVDQGLSVLQTGIDHYPSFVLFSKLLVYADRPRTDPDFQQALQAVDANINACGDLATTRDPACRNSEHALHNVQGSAVFLGDVYAKAGRKADALSVYQAAKQTPDFGSWAFASLIDDRINTLDARVAAFADADASNDPESAWTSNVQCMLCHQR